VRPASHMDSLMPSKYEIFEVFIDSISEIFERNFGNFGCIFIMLLEKNSDIRNS
jgi:hypothetical protein